MASSDERNGFICCIIFAFFGFWTFFSIVGAIHYSVWYPHFELSDMRIRNFNVTPAAELNFDMDIVIEARHFSSIRRIEQYSYEVRTSHVGLDIGASSVPGFHPIHNKTMEIVSKQAATQLPMGSLLGELVRKDLNTTGRVALRVYIEGQIYTSLFLAQKQRNGMICDLIVSPGKPLGSQIYEKKCCGELRCMSWCGSGESRSCCRQAQNCCLLPPSDLRSTISICG